MPGKTIYLLYSEVKSGCWHPASPEWYFTFVGCTHDCVSGTPYSHTLRPEEEIGLSLLPRVGFLTGLELSDLTRLNRQPVPGFSWFCPYGRVPGVCGYPSFHKGAVALNSEPHPCTASTLEPVSTCSRGLLFLFMVVASLMECEVATVT